MTTEQFYLITAYVLAGLVGLCVGSFLNVVIYRVPLGMNIAKPGSHCPNCNAPIRWYDNIPVVSYLVLRGKCRNCKAPISPRYTCVELANTVLWIACVFRFWKVSPLYALLSMAVCSLLICVFFIDLEHKIVLDRFQIAVGAAGILSIFCDPSPLSGWLSHLIGGVVGLLSFWLISWAAEKMLGREGLGGGDVKFAAVMGLFLGWQKLILAVLIASVTASVVMLIAKRHSEDKEFPFAPFLTSGFAIAMLFGDNVFLWYFSLLLL